MKQERYAELVQRSVRGDVAAFEELIGKYKQGLYAYLFGMTGGDHAAAADILQESFLKAFLNISRFRGEASFMTWLWRIARNEFVDYCASPKTSKNLSVEDLPEKELAQDNDFHGSLHERDRGEHLRRLIGSLSPEHREVLELVDLQELRYDDAARIVGISEGALKSRLFRARERLFALVLENRELFS